MRFVFKKYIYKIGQYNSGNSINSNKMFKSKSYNVEKASKKNEASFSSSSSSSSGMTLKTKDKIKSANNKESPEYRRKALPKKITSTKWVENKTFENKTNNKSK